MYDSRRITLYGNFTRKTFDLKMELKLKEKGDEPANTGIQKYRKWYEEQVMSPLWNKDVNFKLGALLEYYGTVSYHGPIPAMKFKQSICFCLQCVDGKGNSRSETYFVRYDNSNSSVTCWSHDSHIYPPGNDYLLIYHNGINHFKWIKPYNTSSKLPYTVDNISTTQVDTAQL